MCFSPLWKVWTPFSSMRIWKFPVEAVHQVEIPSEPEFSFSFAAEFLRTIHQISIQTTYKKYQKIEEMSCKNRSKKKYFTLWSSSGRILKVSFQCYHSFSPYTQPYIPSRDDMNGVLKQHQPFQKNTEVLDLLVS